MKVKMTNCLKAVLLGALATTFIGAPPVALARDASPAPDNPPAQADAREQADRAPDQQPDVEKSKADKLVGPSAVHKHMQEDAEVKPFLFDVGGFAPLQAERDKLYERTGLRLGADYNALYLIPTSSLGEDTSGSGVLRLFLKWDLLGRGTKDTGSLVAKGGNRHAYTDIAPIDYAPEVGYAGLLNLSHSDQRWRMTNLYWRQSLFDGRFISYIGFIDVTDYTDIYPLASYYTNFSNLVFGSGSGTMGGLPDGALGAMAGLWLTDEFYAIAGIGDLNADQTALFEGFETFFDDFETFKSLELGWSPTRDAFLAHNIHVTFYQIDKRQDAGTPNGWGVSASFFKEVGDSWQIFLRGGWGEDGGSPLEAAISAGFGYQGLPAGGLFAVGLNWGRPNPDTYGEDLDDQFTSEIFYRIQVTKNLQFTPSVQLLGNPALNPDKDFIAVFGFRGRVAF